MSGINRRRMERMEAALQRILQWSQAYPIENFPKPDEAYWAKAREVLEANDMTLDRISADNMRHVITQVGKIAEDGLA
jgi:hypothetical protein